MKKGDLVLVTGNERFSPDKWLQLPIRCRYGKIVEVKIRYDVITGKKNPPIYCIRHRNKEGSYIVERGKKYLKVLNIK